VGYENRIMASEDFEDDMKDAGELGAGHTVTALYEIIPTYSIQEVRKTGELKYQENTIKAEASISNEIMTVKFRYKRPGEEVSRLIEKPVTDADMALDDSSENFRFSAAVAVFGMILRDSDYKGDFTYEDVITLAKDSRGEDRNGYRGEFIRLVKTCALLER
jgi:Ca-activated chloride channel family protein